MPVRFRRRHKDKLCTKMCGQIFHSVVIRKILNIKAMHAIAVDNVYRNVKVDCR